MTEDFKPFYVEHSGPTAPDGRYLIVAIKSASAPSMPEVLMMMVGVNMETKTIHKIPLDSVKFVGFRGECMMCDHRLPEDI